MGIKIFIDSDVFISSLISQKGAAYFLINLKTNVQLYLSNLSKLEIEKVAQRMELDRKQMKKYFDKCKSVTLELEHSQLEDKFSQFTADKNDVHIVAGAVSAKANFLATYNIRDYYVDVIKDEFGLICQTPGNILQYLRLKGKLN